ncbi:MAG: hypothetical protein COV33_01710 [Candidatus Zambryskibacteria bacterium CG10_big_fil_rev_8_21_14_0_10_34_34]|uniref:Uncharacterized protein n=1 Tax=Candidatus Zambryskibacteria bacterium CG10_big_fil_rev_8_21_14_0_10_34_34 TaxID=1975114 RepID=A0A2H0R0J3_9BACT|nr:MAG: hypothetical protein COV33_01710 [Candidatus Zambryskibacteria bacterium CG10_big_fil_rev_8_21_14_0_10_34_34]
MNKLADYNKILNEAHEDFSGIFKSKYSNIPQKLNTTTEKDIRCIENTKLYSNNKIYDFMDGDYIYLVHITTKKKDIVNEKRIMCSGGCLVGSIYCVPAYKISKNKFTLHNLGKFIFQKEVSYFSENNSNPSILLFKIKKPKNFKYSGLNYLKLGKFHMNVYQELKFLLHINERRETDEMILKMVDWSRELIYLLYKYKRNILYKDFDNFYTILKKTITNVPIFGYFLFEITSEFVVSYQNDENSKYYAKKREIFVGNFKDLVFGVVPNLTKNFDLGQFLPDINKLEIEFDKLGLDIKKYKIFMINSLIYYVKNYLFNKKINQNFFSENISIMECNKICPHFVGHILHRIIRKMNRYPDFHVNFDTYKAIKIWNYWNKNNIYFPSNSIMPKGEMGINPTIPDLEYTVYDTKVLENDEKKFIFEPKKKLDIKITPQLIELSKLIMRKKYEK